MAEDLQPPGGRWREPEPSRLRWLLLPALALLAWVALHPRGVAVEVVGKTWRREVDIEARVQEMFSERCAQMPAEARLQERRLHEGDEFCRFVAPAWRKGRVAAAAGQAQDAPAWPVLVMEPGERAGPQRAWQELALRDEAGAQLELPAPLPEWQAWRLGARTRLNVHRFSGVADCASLPAAPP